MHLNELSAVPKVLQSSEFKLIEPQLARLDKHLTLRTYLEGYSLSDIDSKIWVSLRSNKAAVSYLKRNLLVNLCRWYKFVELTHPEIQEEIKAQVEKERAKRVAASKAGGSYAMALQDTDKGVVTRFPPEPSGYLHIGHLKAAMLNDYFAHELYQGTLLLRFDDTNPSKEKQEYQDSIVEDLKLAGIKPDKTSFTSDYLGDLYEYCIRLIKEGHAYTDDTDQETMRDQRMKGIASKNRNNSVETNLALFQEMKVASEIGLKNCVRAKMSIDNPNKAMRDPVIYRCNLLPHHRTGEMWKIYPTYDFACPIVDSMEGVTHALRTTEYTDRNPQYQWFLDTLNLRQVHVWDFARMNFIRTVLSKRKLTKLVDSGVVWGWDDPRMPTIRGVRRHGMTISALRDFILKQGPSRNIVVMDWTLFWASNKKEIDTFAARHTAVKIQDSVKAKITNVNHISFEEKPKVPKNPSLGTKKVAFSSSIILDQEDVALMKLDEEITLMAWGNAIVRKINGSNPITDIELELNLKGDVRSTEKKVTWLATEQDLVMAETWKFDHLFTKDKLEEDDNWEDFVNKDSAIMTQQFCDLNTRNLKVDDIIQLERKGYFRVDKAADNGENLVLFEIPTGKTK
ncbi:putative glutamate--tRNA ligase, cytoplasmic [Golovinomyces cichoracearum]|uniref:glutamate--tRNA ligase n=1 Tax=Golovinomyces cichoracearum TaxID=62708 RepID=A0A420J730_9PEZI|nr:putative glutamate--tRNA ligase, cytoplasmic [Golovinomyces cichoracearum]